MTGWGRKSRPSVTQACLRLTAGMLAVGDFPNPVMSVITILPGQDIFLQGQLDDLVGEVPGGQV